MCFGILNENSLKKKYNRSKNINITIISNIGNNIWEMKKKIEEIM
jgi:hypothetical protein